MNESTKLEIYPNKAKNFEKELKRLDKENISSKNKELITKFQNYLFSKGSKEERVGKLSSQLRAICRWILNCLSIHKDLNQLNKEEAQRLIAFINRLEEISEATKSDYRRVIKQFYYWLKDEDKRLNNEERIETEKFYKYLEREVSIKYKIEQADPNTIITEEDLMLVVEKGCRTPKEKAFISLLHETGCRAGEFLNLRVGDIKLKDSYAELNIPFGKTGKRVVYIVKSLPYLLRYLDIHSYKENNISYLWLSDARFNQNEPLLHKGGQKLIDRCFERAKLNKRHNWHWFRHSRATILAPKMPEVMLCKYMGWVIGSHQIKTYVHLCSKQLEDVFLSINNIKKNDDNIEQPIKCICGTLNNKNERYCYKCFRPLNVEVVIQDKELINSEINKTIQFFMDMAKNPELMKQFEEFKKTLIKKDMTNN